MTVFADSSALVKLYAREAHSDAVRAVDVFAVSVLSRVEVVAALWRKHRTGDLDRTSVRVLTRALEADWSGADLARWPLVVVRVTDAVLSEAAALVAMHGLRAYDAVQLATASTTRRVDPACDTVACFDRQLRRAAAAEGFDLLV